MQQTETENKCKCGNEGTDEHPCPYQQDIYDDNEYMCNCCDDCFSECCYDI